MQFFGFLVNKIQGAGETGHGQGNGDADSIKIVQGVILLAQIKKGLQKIIVPGAEIVLEVVDGLFPDPLTDLRKIIRTLPITLTHGLAVRGHEVWNLE
jgi:hypothetical protein